jgi:hypothetical protein
VCRGKGVEAPVVKGRSYTTRNRIQDQARHACDRVELELIVIPTLARFPQVRQDARLIPQLLIEDRFPRIWVPSWENRDLRQLLWHRHRMVQARTRIMNQLQAVVLNEGLRCKKRFWRDAGREQLQSFKLDKVGRPLRRNAT